MKIFKYALPLAGLYGEQEIEMPANARVLSVIEQNKTLMIYAIVDVESRLEKRMFYVVGTGWSISPKFLMFPFIGTVQIDDLVWHVFG